MLPESRGILHELMSRGTRYTSHKEKVNISNFRRVTPLSLFIILFSLVKVSIPYIKILEVIYTRTN